MGYRYQRKAYHKAFVQCFVSDYFHCNIHTQRRTEKGIQKKHLFSYPPFSCFRGVLVINGNEYA